MDLCKRSPLREQIRAGPRLYDRDPHHRGAPHEDPRPRPPSSPSSPSRAILLVSGACEGDPKPGNVTWEAPSGRESNASVTGTVTYRERLALTPDATLIVELRDVSYADASRPPHRPPDHLRARPGPHQVRPPAQPRRHQPPQHLWPERPDYRARRPPHLHQRHRLRRHHPGQSRQGRHAPRPGGAPARPGGRQRGLAHLGRGPGPHRLGQPDSRRVGELPAHRLLSVHRRRLRPPRQPGAWR